jgi:hypothetical protein
MIAVKMIHDILVKNLVSKREARIRNFRKKSSIMLNLDYIQSVKLYLVPLNFRTLFSVFLFQSQVKKNDEKFILM